MSTNFPGYILQMQLINELYLKDILHIDKEKYETTFKELFDEDFENCLVLSERMKEQNKTFLIAETIANLIRQKIKESQLPIYKKINKNINNLDKLRTLTIELLKNNICSADYIRLDKNSIKEFVMITEDNLFIIDNKTFTGLTQNLFNNVAECLFNKNLRVEKANSELNENNYYERTDSIIKASLFKNSLGFEAIPQLETYKDILTLQRYPMVITLGSFFLDPVLYYQEGEDILQRKINNNTMKSLIDINLNNNLSFIDNKFLVNGKPLTELLKSI